MHSVALDTLALAGVPTGEGLTIARALVHRRTVRVYSFSYTVCIRLAPSLQADSTPSENSQYILLSVL